MASWLEPDVVGETLYIYQVCTCAKDGECLEIDCDSENMPDDLLHLITDRTAEDYIRWKKLRDKGWAAMSEEERTEWLSPMKGSYNYTDMNRVENAVQHITGRMADFGYPINLNINSAWSILDKPTRADFDRYFGNVVALRSMITVYTTTPPPVTTDKKFDYQAANDLEKTLQDIDELITKLSLSWFYSGDIFAGEV